MSNPTEYDFAGTQLSSGMAREIIRSIVPAGVHSRHDIIEMVKRHHLKRGGLMPNDLTGCVKKALADLKLEREVEPTGVVGYWKVLVGPQPVLNIDVEAEADESPEAESPGAMPISLDLSVTVTVKTPSGTQTVELVPKVS